MIDAKDLSAGLLAAERDRRAVAPFSDAHPDLDVETAYRAQDETLAAKLAAGERRVGAKLGLVSKAKQREMNVDEPLHGWVTSGMLAPYGMPLDVSTLIQPRLEPEIALLLGRDVETPATVTSVLAATESVFGALDVLDSRYLDYRFTLPDVVADNASAALFYLGPEARPPEALVDLRLIGCVLRRDGEVVATAAGAAAMGHPAAAVAWLANRLAQRKETLRAGDLVFTGGLTAPVAVSPGSVVTAEFDGLGAVEVASR